MSDSVKDIEQWFPSRAQTRIITYFLDNPGEPLRISRISYDTRLSKASIIQAVQNLERLGLVVKEQVGVYMYDYTLAKNARTKLLIKFLKDIRRLTTLDDEI